MKTNHQSTLQCALFAKALLFFFLMSIGSLISAQDDQSDTRPQRLLNNVNIGIAGDASLYSITYDRLFPLDRNLFLSTKVGFGYNEEFVICFGNSRCSEPKKYKTIPFHLTGIFGKGRHFLELGLGATYIFGDPNPINKFITYPIIGYRLIPFSMPICFRLFSMISLKGYDTSESGLDIGNVLFSPIGISLGFSF